MIEAESIPYEPAQLRGERLLVLAPHPDDEVIGCGGLVAQHLREHRQVRIVVATDGAAGGPAAVREEESRRGVARLGQAEMEMLRLPDRQLTDQASEPVREQLLAFRPDLILVPSPIEIHPDHAALARVFCELVQRDESLFAELAVARAAFYEVGQPLRPNAIVDISDVAEAKYAAIAEHASQLAVRDYVGYARGLNAYRAMTLPPETKFAEAYYVVDLPSLRTTSLSELRRRIGGPPEIKVVGETLPISVVIRTKDRPALLREAFDSALATRYPCEIVIVNDGGIPLPTDLAASEPARMKIVRHEESRGRSEAANSGIRAATSPLIAFLDDDDLFYPEHLATLANGTRSSHAAWYSDAVSTFLRPGSFGAYESYSQMRIYAQDFDRELLLVDNYIPLPTLLFPRASLLEVNGFDPAFDLFEDWDLLIRLSKRGDFLRLPRVTCEVRHFEGGTSTVLASPEGSERFRAAKMQIWKKHSSSINLDLVANVFERQKGRLVAMSSQLVEAQGLAGDRQRNIDRLDREKGEVLRQNMEAQNSLNGYALRVRELEAAVSTLTPIVEAHEGTVERMSQENQVLRQSNREIQEEIGKAHAALGRSQVEIDRLNGLLAMIYRSRTWKLHTFLEKLRGRG